MGCEAGQCKTSTPFSFYFCKYSFFIFIYSVFNDIFFINNITNIFDNLYITGSLNRDKFLYCNCKVTGESIRLFEQENKFKDFYLIGK